MQAATMWLCRGRELSLAKPLVMGIVNVTPDSFSDGGEHNTYEAAVAWGRKLAHDGAAILDVGGESTRPGAAEVSVDEELARVIPVVKTLASDGCVVSVDTSKPEVMQAAVEAGALILNDIRAFALPGAAEVAAKSGVGLVIMHMQGTPRTMQAAPHYDDLLGEVESFLREREKVLVNLGADLASICWDPGFGFGKTVDDNWELLAATPRFVASGRPFLMGLSRKSSIGAVAHEKEAHRRVAGSVEGALIAIERGAQVVRVHDVAETVQALAVWEAVRAADQRLAQRR